MHDFFDVLGLSASAHPLEVRRVSARYVRRCHPDFLPRTWPERRSDAPLLRDAAVDYVEPAALLERIQASFFATAR